MCFISPKWPEKFIKFGYDITELRSMYLIVNRLKLRVGLGCTPSDKEQGFGGLVRVIDS